MATAQNILDLMAASG